MSSRPCPRGACTTAEEEKQTHGWQVRADTEGATGGQDVLTEHLSKKEVRERTAGCLEKKLRDQ